MKDFITVIPSIRNVKNVDNLNCEIIVVDDSNGKIKSTRKNMRVYDYRKQKEFFKRLFKGKWKEYYDMIPHKTDTCRSFGFLVALHEGWKKVVTIDDDVILPPDFLKKHNVIGKYAETRPLLSLGWGWYNPIDMLKMKPDDIVYARGYPRWERDGRDFFYGLPKRRGRVILNCGLWTNIPDIDAMDKITETSTSKGFKNKLLKRVSLEMGAFAPLSIMNLSFLSEAVPAFYQVPMKYNFGNGETIDRFGDVFSSYIIEHLVGIKRDVISIGEPLVKHMKEGNLLQEIKNEMWGHIISPIFYDMVNNSMKGVEKSDYAIMYEQFVNNFLNEVNRMKTKLVFIQNYFKFIVRNMERWCEACQTIIR